MSQKFMRSIKLINYYSKTDLSFLTMAAMINEKMKPIRTAPNKPRTNIAPGLINIFDISIAWSIWSSGIPFFSISSAAFFIIWSEIVGSMNFMYAIEKKLEISPLMADIKVPSPSPCP